MSLSGSVFGRLTKDPEVKQSQNGKNYAMISVAINNGKNQDGTDRVATFLNIKAFGKQGEIISQSFKKGHRIKADINQIESSAWVNQQSGQAQGGINAILVGFDFVETKADEQGQQAPPQSYALPAQQQGYNQPPAQPDYGQAPPQQAAPYAPQPGYGQLPARPQQPPAPQQQQNYGDSPWG